MDRKSSAELIPPWSQIIEHLAKFKPSLLDVISKVAPKMPAHLRENMEVEELCGRTNGSMNSTLSSLESKAKIDTSKSCKNSLQHMFHNGSASDLGVTASELSKWDFHSSSMDKRATMPKTALEELKEAILGGTHPHAESLKKLSRLAPVSHLGRSVIHNVNDGRTGLACVPDVGDAYAPSTVDEPNLVSCPTGHMERLEGDDDIRIGLPTKRNHTDFHAENIGRDCNEKQHHDTRSDAKRAKQQDSDEIKDREESPVVPTGRLGFERTGGCSEREMANLVEGRTWAADEDQLLVGHGRHYVQPWTCDVLSHGMEWGFSIDDSTRIHDSIDKMKNRESARASQWRQTSTSNVEDHVAGEETSSDSDEYRKEDMDVTMKKKEFFCSQSQCPPPRNAFATVDWNEQNVCTECNEGGQLLVCNTSSCPLMVHENCVGLSAMFDDNGTFHCPFCAHSISISEIRDAKKKASATRKNLSAFTCAGIKHQQENLDVNDRQFRGRKCSKAYASCGVLRRSARIRSLAWRSKKRTKDNDVIEIIEVPEDEDEEVVETD